MEIYKCFTMHLPENLYLNHYRLHDVHPEHSPDEWRRFLKDNDHFIRTELSAITEAEARSALQKLTTGTAKSADISAIKQILEQSQALNAQTKDARTFITTHMNQPKAKPPTQQERIAINLNNARKVFSSILQDNLVCNSDGTIHILNPQTDLELCYLRLFNPDNIRNQEFEHEVEEDLQ